ncbi:MAG: SOS response-associated peptidase [Planctomycetaceae bacterium]
MCGRYNLRTPAAALAEIFRALDPPEISPRFNIAPTQQVLIVRQDDRRAFAQVRWGLIPPWAKDEKGGPPLINARAETVRDKPAFRHAFERQRCLIPADGFYEWQKLGKAKQPFHIAMRDKKPFAFAGLWERWTHGPQPVDSCTIVTTTANDLLRPLHDRMPVIVAPAEYDTWLAGAPDDAARLLIPYPAEALRASAVGLTVNNARNETPECIEPLASPPA